MQNRLAGLLVVSCLLATSTSCPELWLPDLLPEPPTAYPKIHITDPVAESKFTTTETTVRICGEIEVRKPKLFTREIFVKNKTNGFIIVLSVVNTDGNSRTAQWCTSADIPLEIGKNKIFARIPRQGHDGIVIVRAVGPCGAIRGPIHQRRLV